MLRITTLEGEYPFGLRASDVDDLSERYGFSMEWRDKELTVGVCENGIQQDFVKEKIPAAGSKELVGHVLDRIKGVREASLQRSDNIG